MVMHVFIVDDEALARRRLRSIVAGLHWARVVGEAADGQTALDGVARLRPDIVLLDICMPEVSGMEVLARLGHQGYRPAVVLTTAHEDFAVSAFELEAVDYVLKPIAAARCVAALERARRSVEMRRAEAMLTRGPQHPVAESARPLDHILVRNGSILSPVNLSGVSNIEAQDDYVLLHLGDRSHLAGIRMFELERRLPSPPFLRVHRSHIVNLDHVRRITNGIDGRLSVELANDRQIPVSRDRAKEVRRLIR